MSIGNIVGTFVCDTAANFSKFVCEKAASANQMAGEAFTNPTKLIEEVRSGANYALTNKVHEFAASSAIILGAGIAGVVLAKKAYNIQCTTFGKLVTKIALGAASLAFLSAAAYETFARVSESRLTGRCLNAALGVNQYSELGCESLLGKLYNFNS